MAVEGGRLGPVYLDWRETLSEALTDVAANSALTRLVTAIRCLVTPAAERCDKAPLKSESAL